MDNNTSNNTQTESFVSIKDILNVFLRHWYWFVISVGLCCSVAVFKILKTNPEYTRNAILLIKESNTRRSASSEVEALLSQTGNMTSKIANEVVVFQSPSLMSEAVSRLGLTTSYAIKGRFKNNVVYGAGVPVKVDFSKIPDDYHVSFRVMPLSDSLSVEISKITYSVNDDKFKVKGTYTAVLGEPLVLPFGEVTLSANPYYYSETAWERPEIVSKRSLASASRSFSSRFHASTEQTKSNVRPSDILTLSLTDYSIQRADDLINMIITIYNERWVIDNNKMSQSTSVFLEDRLDVIENELNRVDENITKYKSKNKMPNVEATSQMYMTQTTDIEKQIRSLESELSVAKYLRSFMSNSLDENTLIPLPSGINSTSISSQIEDYNTALLNRNHLLSVSSEKNPLVMDLGERMADMRIAINSSLNNQVATLEEQIAFTRNQQIQTEDKIAQNPTQAMDLIKYERLQTVQENLYLFLLQKREENELSQAFSAYNTRVVNPPYGSPIPVSPNTSNILLIAFVIGLLIPCAWFYLRLVTDNKIHSRKDIEGLNATYLGEIPLLEEARLSNNPIRRMAQMKQPQVKSRIVVEKGCRNLINEAFRIVRANLEFVSKGDDSRVLLFTSMNAGSGKTFTSINLGAALAINGSKVLLIDCDFRRLTLSYFFGEKHRGFAEYLHNPEKDITEYIRKDVKYENLDLLPVGTLPPNPSELLNRPEFAAAIESLKKVYDYIIIDAAPYDIVADTQIIAPVADRTLFVVRAERFLKDDVAVVNKLIESNKYKNMSVILNGTVHYGGGHYHSYRYGHYGYSYSKSNYYTSD